MCQINPNFELGLINKPLLRRKRGEELVEKMQSFGRSWEEMEKKCETIQIDLHQATGMNLSFFLGAFGLRVKALGVDGFKNKYQFINNDVINNEINNSYIIAALLELPS